ncbi:MAG: nucleoside deaminase, partial [Actinomycetota bacterium]
MANDVERDAMQVALDLAREASEAGEVPVGAVVVRDGRVIAARRNEREVTNDPTAHAEVLALRDAASIVGSWNLSGCTLVVTLEPCPMCAGAILNSRVSRLVFGAADPKAGATGTLYNLMSDPRLNHDGDGGVQWRMGPDGIERARCSGRRVTSSGHPSRYTRVEG